MIQTYSKFYLGVDIESNNSWVDFNEGLGVLSFQLEYGTYTLSEIADALIAGFNSVGTLTYDVDVNRQTRVITISASGNFSLPMASGPNAGFNALLTLGYTSPAKTGAATYTASNPCVEEYVPQFMLQSYVPADNWIESADATKNKSADGRIEVVRFGRDRKIQMDIKFITSMPMDGIVIKNNPTGYEDALMFLDYITQSKNFEFMPDANDEDDFTTVILESIPTYADGTGFKLIELYAQGLRDIYETGIMVLREVN